MRVLRRRLPMGWAAVLFCSRRTVVVEKSLSEAVTLAAVAIAVERCDGLLAVVMRSEVRKVARLVA